MSESPAPLVTVAGGTGFIGSHLVRLLLKEGFRIRLLSTREVQAEEGVEVKVCNFLSPEDCGHALQGARAVVNLVGIIVEKPGRDFYTTHVTIPEHLARVASESKVSTFVHISALGASLKSRSRYKVTKAQGEEKVKEYFPDAVILRPSVVISGDSNFVKTVEYMSRMTPVIPVPRPDFRFRPVHVDDLCELIKVIIEKEMKGRVLEVCGPDIMTNRELFELALRILKKKRPVVGVPLFFAKLGAKVLERAFPWMNLSSESLIALEEEDNVCGDIKPLEEILQRPLKRVSQEL